MVSSLRCFPSKGIWTGWNSTAGCNWIAVRARQNGSRPECTLYPAIRKNGLPGGNEHFALVASAIVLRRHPPQPFPDRIASFENIVAQARSFTRLQVLLKMLRA